MCLCSGGHRLLPLANGIRKLTLVILYRITYSILKQEETLELIKHNLLIFTKGKGQRIYLQRSLK